MDALPEPVRPVSRIVTARWAKRRSRSAGVTWPGLARRRSLLAGDWPQWSPVPPPRRSPGSRIMPAPTVLFVSRSMMMNAPVAALAL